MSMGIAMTKISIAVFILSLSTISLFFLFLFLSPFSEDCISKLDRLDLFFSDIRERKGWCDGGLTGANELVQICLLILQDTSNAYVRGVFLCHQL